MEPKQTHPQFFMFRGYAIFVRSVPSVYWVSKAFSVINSYYLRVGDLNRTNPAIIAKYMAIK